jgi:hypothetical protein
VHRQLLHRDALFGVVGDHAVEQVLEVLGVEAGGFALGVRRPEGVEVFLFYEFVVGVGGGGFLEGWGACVHYE